MTLLVLDLRTPAGELVHGKRDLWRALVMLAPRLLVYLMSFLTLGIFRVGQQTQLNQFERTDRDLAWLHLIFLFAVALMLFSTALIAQFITYRVALIAYCIQHLCEYRLHRAGTAQLCNRAQTRATVASPAAPFAEVTSGGRRFAPAAGFSIIAA